MTPDQYCQDRTAKSGSSFYYSFLFLPPEQRQAITALYAFCREVDDVVDECDDPTVARTKLRWWREEVRNLFKNTPQHPVTQALTVSIERFNLPEEHFMEIIDGMEMDLDQFSYDNFKQLSLYCYRVASVVGLMAAEIFGYKNRQTLKYAHSLGMAFQMTNIIRDVAEDSLRGRIYLPADEMRQFGVSVDDILEQKDSENFRRLIKFQAQRAQEFYDQAFEQLPEEDRYNQRCGLIMSSIYRTTLEEIEKDNFPVLKQRTSLTPIRKLWIAWQSSRNEKKRHKKLLRSAA